MKFFNTAGPMQPDIHYVLPPVNRLNRNELLSLIDERKYFILHAPRQTGKTSCMLALVEELNRSGKYRAVYANIEAAQAQRNQVERAMRVIINEIARQSALILNDKFPLSRMKNILEQFGADDALTALLTEWSAAESIPLVLIFDEIDALIGDTLISVLRQLRAGYAKRPAAFPQTVILCGVRDVRDYRIHTSNQEIITGGSAFNIKAESLRLENFSREEIQALYEQHTAETGQVFDDAIYPLVWELTTGQPWLVNALAYEICFRKGRGNDRTQPVTVELVQEAKEKLIERRDTHLDQLTDKLREDRVRRVIAPILSGLTSPETIPNDDISYVYDLGLITTEGGQIAIANRIYQEVIPRDLTYSTQVTISHQTAWYIGADGRLEMNRLLTAFQQFFREHSEHWVERFDYKEAGPQLLLQAFLQRIVNGGGRIEREYGLGRQRTDLLVIWNHPQGIQRVVLELKLRTTRLETVIEAGLQQTWEYLDRCAGDEGHLVIFDRDPGKPWEEKIFHRTETVHGRTLEIWGM
ncbi:MAG: AAA-like domain-containing protein [Acidobacteria bacterium]|nr:AAA-like domain-containing protein [Acidobacteriota bacterium]